MPTSLRQFEDWHTPGDDAMRAGYPAQSLTDVELATRQAELDAARRASAVAPVPPPPTLSADPWADPRLRLERAAHALEQARAEFAAAAKALRQAQRAEREQARKLRQKSDAERRRRNSAQLGASSGFSLMR